MSASSMKKNLALFIIADTMFSPRLVCFRRSASVFCSCEPASCLHPLAVLRPFQPSLTVQISHIAVQQLCRPMLPCGRCMLVGLVDGTATWSSVDDVLLPVLYPAPHIPPGTRQSGWNPGGSKQIPSGMVGI
jgi:hypothetical protein